MSNFQSKPQVKYTYFNNIILYRIRYNVIFSPIIFSLQISLVLNISIFSYHKSNVIVENFKNYIKLQMNKF